VGSAQPDFEGMRYYHVRRAELDQNAKLQA
jgi:hypothetical protein